jgi:hypothetical protein
MALSEREGLMPNYGVPARAAITREQPAESRASRPRTWVVHVFLAAAILFFLWVIGRGLFW